MSSEDRRFGSRRPRIEVRDICGKFRPLLSLRACFFAIRWESGFFFPGIDSFRPLLRGYLCMPVMLSGRNTLVNSPPDRFFWFFPDGYYTTLHNASIHTYRHPYTRCTPPRLGFLFSPVSRALSFSTLIHTHART